MKVSFSGATLNDFTVLALLTRALVVRGLVDAFLAGARFTGVFFVAVVRFLAAVIVTV